MVSHRGCQILDRYPVLGGIMALRMSKNLLPFFTSTAKSKPVICTDSAPSASTIRMTSGARLRFSSTTAPLGSV